MEHSFGHHRHPPYLSILLLLLIPEHYHHFHHHLFHLLVFVRMMFQSQHRRQKNIYLLDLVLHNLEHLVTQKKHLLFLLLLLPVLRYFPENWDQLHRRHRHRHL